MTKSTSACLLPAGSLCVNPPLLWEWWLQVASLRHGSLPSSVQGDQRNGRHDRFWGLSWKHKNDKPQLNQRESNPSLCSTEVNSCVFPANLMPGEMTEQPLLTYSSSPILSWVLTCTHWLPVLIPVNHSTSGSADGHLGFGALIPLPPSHLQQWLPQWVSCASRSCPVAQLPQVAQLHISPVPMSFLAFGREQQHPWTHACQLRGSLPRCISVINLPSLCVSLGVSMPHKKRQEG